MRTALVVVIALLGLVLLAGCAKRATTMEPPQVPLPPAPGQTLPRAPSPAPVAIEPLRVDLRAEPSEAPLNLTTRANCVAIGGQPPYEYSWSQASCAQESCQVVLSRVGERSISCTVTDETGASQSDGITLRATKLPVDIQQVVVVGDSLAQGFRLDDPSTQSWSALLAKEWGAEWIDVAQDGSTSWGARDQAQALPQKTTTDTERMVFVWVGANDIARGVSAEDYQQNLRALAHRFTALPATRVYFLLIPDVAKHYLVDELQQGANQYLSQLGVQVDLKTTIEKLIDRYNDRLRAVAQDEGVAVLEPDLSTQRFNATVVGGDHVHPSVEGHRLIAESLSEQISASAPDRLFK